MGECRECAHWEPQCMNGQQVLTGICRAASAALDTRFSVDGRALYTRANFGCVEFRDCQPAAPGWQALAERRGAALTEMLERVTYGYGPSAIISGSLADLQGWKAARDAGPEGVRG